MRPVAHVDTFYHLVTDGVGEDQPPEPPSTVWRAAGENDAARVRAILLADPDMCDSLCEEFGNTPAICAAARDCIDVLSVLQQHRADLNKRAVRGVTPTFAAAATGSTRCLRFLIGHGGRIDDTCRGLTPFEWLLAPQRTVLSRFDSRLAGRRLLTARMLVLSGAHVGSRAIPHQQSREIMLDWARRELTDESGRLVWLAGVQRAGGHCTLARLDIEGVKKNVMGFLPQRTRLEMNRLANAVGVWEAEVAQEMSFERGWLGGIDPGV